MHPALTDRLCCLPRSGILRGVNLIARIFATVCVCSFVACGAAPRPSRAPASVQIEPTHLPEVLGPNGAALPAAQLDAIARYLRRLERNPTPMLLEYDGVVLHATTLLLRWVVDSPDVGVVVDGWVAELAGPRENPWPHGALAATLGMAAYQIEHRSEHLDPAGDQVQLAGVESVLRWYEALMREGAEHRPAIDAAIADRDRGALPAWLAARRAGR